MDNEIILELLHLSYRYPDGTLALDNVSLKIERGKKIGILGGNGAGKSTLFLLMNGVYKALAGKILFEGRELTYKPADLYRLRKNIGLVFQNPETQIFSASVYEEISFGLLNLGVGKDEAQQRIDYILDALHIKHLQDKPTHLLSYGEKKRVSIASVLVMEPEICIFDEPASCLDARETQELIRLYADMSARGKTILLATHDIDFLYAWADRIVVMEKGAVLKTGNPLELFDDSELLDALHLEKPFILRFYEMLQELSVIDSQTAVPKSQQELLSCLKTARASKLCS